MTASLAFFADSFVGPTAANITSQKVQMHTVWMLASTHWIPGMLSPSPLSAAALVASSAPTMEKAEQAEQMAGASLKARQTIQAAAVAVERFSFATPFPTGTMPPEAPK